MSDATETTNETPATKIPLENMIVTSETLASEALAAQIRYEESLQALAAEHGSTYTDPRNGQVCQIRHRVDSKQGRPITYLCALKAEPKTWLTGRAKKTADTTTTVAAAAASVVPETGGATVIE